MSSLHRLTLVTSQGIVNHGLSPSNQPTHQNTTSSLSTNNNSTNSLDKCDNSHHYSDKPPQYNEVVTEVSIRNISVEQHRLEFFPLFYILKKKKTKLEIVSLFFQSNFIYLFSIFIRSRFFSCTKKKYIYIFH